MVDRAERTQRFLSEQQLWGTVFLFGTGWPRSWLMVNALTGLPHRGGPPD